MSNTKINNLAIVLSLKNSTSKSKVLIINLLIVSFMQPDIISFELNCI